MWTIKTSLIRKQCFIRSCFMSLIIVMKSCTVTTISKMTCFMMAIIRTRRFRMVMTLIISTLPKTPHIPNTIESWIFTFRYRPSIRGLMWRTYIFSTPARKENEITLASPNPILFSQIKLVSTFWAWPIFISISMTIKTGFTWCYLFISF